MGKEGETGDAYFLRVRLQSGRLASKMGKWSGYWAGAVKAWHLHLERGVKRVYWPSDLYQFQSLNFLEDRRLKLSRGRKLDRTGTRVMQGHVHKRWHEGLELAKSIASHPASLPVGNRFFGSQTPGGS